MESYYADRVRVSVCLCVPYAANAAAAKPRSGAAASDAHRRLHMVRLLVVRRSNVLK